MRGLSRQRCSAKLAQEPVPPPTAAAVVAEVWWPRVPRRIGLRGARGLPLLVGRRSLVPLQLCRRTSAKSTWATTTARTTTATRPTTRRRSRFAGSVRPFATGKPVLRGLRLHAFYDTDHYVADAERERFIGSVTYGHHVRERRVRLPRRRRRTSAPPGAQKLDGRGYSIWANPKQSPTGWEFLRRYDHLEPNHGSSEQERNRTIAGIASGSLIRAR